ncbi:hypothetical protein FRB94_013779 [Tulasnella sp. JGI-2019a]|nr:hypothetical protein FRB94_013779 [Tulasnella sp. JGI-2019a]
MWASGSDNFHPISGHECNVPRLAKLLTSASWAQSNDDDSVFVVDFCLVGQPGEEPACG